jgi:hypothetical protein
MPWVERIWNAVKARFRLWTGHHPQLHSELYYFLFFCMSQIRSPSMDNRRVGYANDHGEPPPQVMKPRFASPVSPSPALPRLRERGAKELLHVNNLSPGSPTCSD